MTRLTDVVSTPDLPEPLRTQIALLDDTAACAIDQDIYDRLENYFEGGEAHVELCADLNFLASVPGGAARAITIAMDQASVYLQAGPADMKQEYWELEAQEFDSTMVTILTVHLPTIPKDELGKETRRLLREIDHIRRDAQDGWEEIVIEWQKDPETKAPPYPAFYQSSKLLYAWHTRNTAEMAVFGATGDRLAAELVDWIVDQWQDGYTSTDEAITAEEIESLLRQYRKLQKAKD